MVKAIKGLGLKVQAQIMDEKVRVTGKKKDELQVVIAHFREHAAGIPAPVQQLHLTGTDPRGLPAAPPPRPRPEGSRRPVR